MNDSMIALGALVIGLGLYVTYQHSVIVRYRAWTKQAQYALAMSAALLAEELVKPEEKAMAEYGFDTETKPTEEEK